MNSDNLDDKIEAIALACGRADGTFLAFILDDLKRKDELIKIHEKLPLELIRSALFLELEKHQSRGVRWYTLIALSELGERSNEVLHNLIESSEEFLFTLDSHKDDPGTKLSFWLAIAVRNESLRAISYFKDNLAALNAV